MQKDLKNQNSSSDGTRSASGRYRFALPLALLLLVTVAGVFVLRRNIGSRQPFGPIQEHGSNGTSSESAALRPTNGMAGTNHPPDRGRGVTYMHDVVESAPWSIHIVKVERSHAELRFETTLGLGRHIGMSLVSEQVKALPKEAGHPLAAINGDFYKMSNKYPGDPEGVQIILGELVSAPKPTHSCFWIDATGNPHVTIVQPRFKVTLPDGRTASFGLNEERANDTVVLYTSANGASTRTSDGIEVVLMSAGTNSDWLPLRVGKTYTATVKQVRTNGDAPLSRTTMVLSVGPKISSQVAGLKPGDTVTVSMATTPDMAGSTTAIGGGPALVHGHAPAKEFTDLLRQPRTAFGWNKDYFFLVEVDGRQKISAGMTYSELAAYMLKVGCDEAINLDGGGSATLWVYGTVMNSPSEGRERPAANALVVVRKTRE
jgi:hypothetical protein